MSSGRAASSIVLHYDKVPNSVAEEVIDKAKGRVKDSCMLQTIRIKLKSYDHNLVDKSAERL